MTLIYKITSNFHSTWAERGRGELLAFHVTVLLLVETSPKMGVIHIVLFKFKPDVGADRVKDVRS